MITVMLYGELGKRFGKIHRYDIKSPAEAIQALSVTLKGFKEYFISDNKKYRISRAGKEYLALDDIGNPQSSRETIRIIPYIEGAGDDPITSIVLGAALIIAAPYAASLVSGLGFSGVGAVTAFGASVAGAMGTIGWSLIIGGAAQMLFAPDMPVAQSLEAPDSRPAFSFNGAVNTVTQGNSVPLCYGRMIVGSQVISAGIYSTDYVPT